MSKDLLEENEAYTMIENIYKFKREKAEDLSIIDTIIEYSFDTGIPIQEIGNIISEHKEFMLMFSKQMVDEGYIRVDRDELDKLDVEEW